MWTHRVDAVVAVLEKHLVGAVPFPEEFYLRPSFLQWKKKFSTLSKPPRTAADLRIIFLCDESPSNDVAVLLRLGLLQENIYAVTFQQETRDKASHDLNQHQMDRVKLHAGSIEDFLNSTDIVYFDSCGPLPSGTSSTLTGLNSVLAYGRLASPGALITTFTGPRE